MSEAEAKPEQSLVQLTDEGQEAPAQYIPAEEPPESFAGLARQYPALIIAGGIALGVAAAMMLPRKTRKSLTGRAATLAALAGEAGLTLGRQALDKAGDATREGREKFGELGESLGETLGETALAARRRAAAIAENATGSARKTGLQLVKQAVELAKNARR